MYAEVTEKSSNLNLIGIFSSFCRKRPRPERLDKERNLPVVI